MDGDPYTVWIGLPPGAAWKAAGAEATAAGGGALQARGSVEGPLASIMFTSPAGGAVRWRLWLAR